MLNYIRAEFYKAFRRKYTWIVLIVLLACETLMVSGWVFTNAHGNVIDFYDGVNNLRGMLTIGFAVSMLVCDMVFAGQYKHATLKNEVSFGLPRARIYLGKLIVQTALSVLCCVIILAYYVGLCYVTLPHDPERDAQVMRLFGYWLLCAFPIWLGGQALCCALTFLVRSDLGAAAIAAVLLYVLPPAMELAALLFSRESFGEALMALYCYQPGSVLDATCNMAFDWSWCGKAWLVGAAWCAVSTAAGLIGFRKKEV